MAQMNVAWPTSRQPSTIWQSHAHGVHCFVRKTSWCTVGLSFNLGLGEFPRLTLTPVLAVPGLEAHAVRLPCSCDSSAHKRCGPCTKYTVGLTVRLDGPTALLVLPHIDEGFYRNSDFFLQKMAQ